MKKYSYGINYRYEIKEYKKLCKGKSKKYKNYLEWRDYILELIDGFDAKTLENFRHLCLYNEDIDTDGKDVFLPLAIGLTTLFISLDMGANKNMPMDGGIFAIAAAFISFIITYFYLDYNFSKNFYRDVAEIVKEKIESLSEEERLLITINSNKSQKLLSSNSK